MFSAVETFFTSVGCMDGRVQSVIADFGQKKFGATFPDTITEAGLVGLVAHDKIDMDLLKFKIIDVSVEKHHSKGIIVHGHQECAGNPIDDELHKKDIITAVERIKSLISPSISILPVFVKRAESGWVAEAL